MALQREVHGPEGSTPGALPLILRIGVAGCFVGHGAFGIITKAAWVPYFAAGGVSEPWAWRLMPWIGAIDISVGLLALAWPCRALFVWAAVWGFWTALLRPISGESFWECVERAGNYGVPFALLVAAGWRGSLFGRLPAHWPELSATTRAKVKWTLRLTTAALLAGHAGLGFFVHKAGLGHNYAAVWSEAPASVVPAIGAFEFVLAAAVLFRPIPGVLLLVCAWKIATESLFLVSGSPVWELVERFGSYTAPVALAILHAKSRTDNLSTLSPAAS
jgi:hypothetical protein